MINLLTRMTVAAALVSVVSVTSTQANGFRPPEAAASPKASTNTSNDASPGAFPDSGFRPPQNNSATAVGTAKPNKSAAPKPVATVGITIPKPTKKSAVGAFQGEITFVDEQAYFSPCQGATQYPIHMRSQKSELLSGLDRSGSYYAELIGEMRPTAEGTFEPAEIRPQQWLSLVIEGPGCVDDNTQPVAMGNEPSWSASLAKGDLVVKDLAGTKPYAISESRMEGEQNTWQALGAELALQKQDCFDSMSGNYYSHSATLVREGISYQGCGKLGFPALASGFVGFYEAEIGQGDKLAVELYDDFSAVVKQSNAESETVVIRKGFWLAHVNTRGFIQLQGQYEPMQMTWNGKRMRLFHEKSLTEKSATNLFKMDGPAVAPEPEAPSYQARSFDASTLVASDGYDAEVESALIKYFELHRTDPSGSRYLWWRFDLNGDGYEEILAYLNWCQGEECTLLIFEGQPHGHFFLSKTYPVAAPFFLGADSYAHWQDLLVEKQGELRRLSFDGLSYSLQSIVSPTMPSAGVNFVTPKLGPGWGRRLP